MRRLHAGGVHSTQKLPRGWGAWSLNEGGTMGGTPPSRKNIQEKSLRNKKKKAKTENLGDLTDLKVRLRVLLLDRTPIW